MKPYMYATSNAQRSCLRRDRDDCPLHCQVQRCRCRTARTSRRLASNHWGALSYENKTLAGILAQLHFKQASHRTVEVKGRVLNRTKMTKVIILQTNFIINRAMVARCLHDGKLQSSIIRASKPVDTGLLGLILKRCNDVWIFSF